MRASLFAILVVIAVALAACGAPEVAGKPRPATAPRGDLAGPSLLVRDAENDLFAAADLRASRAEVAPTSLLGSLDGELVERLVRQRLGRVTRLVLSDLIERAVGRRDDRPLQDLVDTIASLVLTDGEAQARSQRLVAAVVRLGATYAFYGLVKAHRFAAHGCPDGAATSTAIYEGLAASTFVGRLGFPAATGHIEDSGCRKLALEVARTVDTLAVLGLELRSVPQLAASLRQVVKDCDSTLDFPATLLAYLAELHEPGGSFLNMPLATLKRAREVTDRYTARLEEEKLGTLVAAHGPCLLAMQRLSSNAEGSVARLLRLLPDDDRQATLDGLQEQLLRVLENFSVRTGDELAAKIANLVDTYEAIRHGTVEKLLAGILVEDKWKAFVAARKKYRDARKTCLNTYFALAEAAADDEKAKTKEDFESCKKALDSAASDLGLQIERLALKEGSKWAEALLAAWKLDRYVNVRALLWRTVTDPSGLIHDLRDSAVAWREARQCVSGEVATTGNPLPDFAPIRDSCSSEQCRAKCGGKIEALEADGVLHLDEVDVAAVEKIAQLRKLADLKLDPKIESLVKRLGSLNKRLVGGLKGVALLRSVAAALVSKQRLSAQEITDFAKSLATEISAMDIPERSKRVLVGILDAVPGAIEEDDKAPAGIRFDTRALTTGMLQKFADDQGVGPYFRATVGAGYVAKLYNGGGSLAPSVHEELGLGMRYPVLGTKRWLWGWHVMTSGLLYSLVPADGTGDNVFAGVGASLNAYRLLDLSINAGPMHTLGGGGTCLAVVASLQLPIVDYLTALTTEKVDSPGESGN